MVSPPPPNKTDRHNITEILLKLALNTINLNQNHHWITDYKWPLILYWPSWILTLTALKRGSFIHLSSLASLICRSIWKRFFSNKYISLIVLFYTFHIAFHENFVHMKVSAFYMFVLIKSLNYFARTIILFVLFIFLL